MRAATRIHTKCSILMDTQRCGPKPCAPCLQEQLETEAMRAGTRLHAELEAQTSKLVEVHVDTWEDFWAVRCN